MAVAALRNLVAKVRIPGAAALRASRASAPQSIVPAPPPPPPLKAEVENALLLKNKIESADVRDLFSSGDLIAKHCEQIEQTISQASERHFQVSRGLRSITVKGFFTGLVFSSINNLMEGYYNDIDEVELEESAVGS